MDVIQLIDTINSYLWGYIVIVGLVCCGLWFTWRSRFMQFRMVGEMFRLLTDSPKVHSEGEKQISSFQAFAVSLASRIGTGNLAGVATAIVVGGPGAVFWMWVMALVGSATAFVESTLGQLFKLHHKDSFIGGPAYYIERGLHSRWMAVLFAVLITITFGCANNSVQSNTICGAMEVAYGISPVTSGIILAVITLFIVFGGIQRIAHISSVMVPFMAIAYILLALVVIIMNIQHIPHVFKVIIDSAFGFEQALGGTVGAAIITGVKRGLFSNEAGEGSAPNAAATADVSHPVKQGLIQSLGVFVDTLVICSCTAFIILISGVYEVSELNGIALTQAALESEVGLAGPVFISMAILLFAYSTIIGNYYYGEVNVRFISKKPIAVTLYRIFGGGVMVMFGALVSLDTVWTMVDLCMGLLTLCNLIAIILLGKYAFRLLDDYRSQKRQGIKSPTFHRSQIPELEKELECWED